MLDENRGDGPNGYPGNAVRDGDPTWAANLGTMIRRDRNHASVVVWVYCNENGCSCAGPEIAAAWGAVATANDPSRPVNPPTSCVLRKAHHRRCLALLLLPRYQACSKCPRCDDPISVLLASVLFIGDKCCLPHVMISIILIHI